MIGAALALACAGGPDDSVGPSDTADTDYAPDCGVDVGDDRETAWSCLYGGREHEFVGTRLFADRGRVMSGSYGEEGFEGPGLRGYGVGYVVTPSAGTHTWDVGISLSVPPRGGHHFADFIRLADQNGREVSVSSCWEHNGYYGAVQIFALDEPSASTTYIGLDEDGLGPPYIGGGLAIFDDWEGREIAVHTYRYIVPRGDGSPDTGAIYFYDLATTGQRDATNAAAMLDYSIPDVNLERPFENAGDVTGDGLSDLLVGEAAYDDRRGAAWLVDTIPTGHALLTDFGNPMEGEATGESVGVSIAAPGDVNGDGYADMMVGSPIAAGRRGRAYLVLGPDAPSSLSDAVGILEGEPAEFIGQNLNGLGDFDGDGTPDMAVAAGHDPYQQQTEPGRALVIRGQDFVGHVDRADALSIASTHLFDGFGSRLAGTGDLNGDGFADIAIAAHLRDTRGVTFLVAGRDW